MPTATEATFPLPQRLADGVRQGANFAGCLTHQPHRTYLRALLCLLLAAATALAQTPGWNLPPGGLVTYKKKEILQQEGGTPNQAPEWYVDHNLPHTALLLESELTDNRRSLRLPPHALRWVIPWLAFDLRSYRAGKVNITVPMVPYFGDLVFDGNATAPTAEGEQTLTLKVTRKPFAVPSDAPKGAAERWASCFDGDGNGTLELVRTFDAKQGVVTAFHGDLKLQTKLGARWQNATPKLLLTQDWQLEEVIPYRAPDFKTRIVDAIRKGAEHLKRELGDPSRPEFATSVEGSTGEGRLALVLLTLLAAGESANDPVLAAGFAELRRRDIKRTYSLALAALAIEKSYAPRNERDDLLSGKLKRPSPRKPSETDRKLLEEWSLRLMKNRDTSVDGAYQSRWWYEGGAGFDNSNTQYALLGLYSTQLCGVRPDKGVWFAAAEHWLRSQNAPEDVATPLLLTSLVDMDGKDLLKLRRTVAGRRVEPRGWNYTLPGTGDAYGSMTCAGIASLSLCSASLDDGKGGRTPLQARMDDAIRSGFAWLSRHHTVRQNAGPPDHADGWWWYWMYSLERACELSRVGLIDGWDWYHDGAQVVLALQRPDGNFTGASIDDACFAVLFLKKAQLPVLTGPR